ncbi:MAG: ATP-binding protein [Ferruginibacter sp.]
MLTTQKLLLNEQEKFEALFHYASLGILVANQQAEITMANSFLLNQFGYTDAAEIVGQKIEVLIPHRFHHTHVKDRNAYIDHPQKRPMGVGMDLYGIKKSGEEFPVEVSLSNFNSEKGKFVIAFISDITRRKEIEEAILAQQKELEIFNKKVEQLNDELEEKVQIRTHQLEETLAQLEASKDELTEALSKEKELSDLKTRFVSMASHEFRTPLSTILSSASLVAKYTQSEEQEKRNKHIHRIKSAVNNLTDILNEFLSIGKIEDGKIVAHLLDFNIKDLIANLCSEIQGITKQGQYINFIHTGQVEVGLDPSLLRNILINLLSNAIKFSPEFSTITIEAFVDESSVKIIVRDNGVGISKDDQEHLFERFFRGTNVTNIQGTGLGLHIVGKYVELMDGVIEFVSELEKGTAFILTFKNNFRN